MIEGDAKDFTAEEIDLLLQNVDQLSDEEAAELYEIVNDLTERKRIQRLRDDLIAFCQHMQEDYKVGVHHRRLAGLLEDIEGGRKDRICVSVAPRHGKSQLVSIYFAAWYMGRNPAHKVMLVSHTTDLAVDFGRKIRNLVASERYKEVFPDVSLASDSKSAGRWSTNMGGEFFACLSPDTPVHTLRGWVPAADVTLADRVVTPTGPEPVLALFNTSHGETIHVAGGAYSPDHLIWTENRGWVEARHVESTDLLRTESFLCSLRVSLWRLTHGYMEHAYVPTVVQHPIEVRKPEQREVSFVRRARHICLRAMAGVRQFLGRYGPPAHAGAYCGPNGQLGPLQPGELPLGDPDRAGQQQAHQRPHRGPDAGGTCTGVEFDARNIAVSYSARVSNLRDSEPEETKTGTLQDPGGTAAGRWLRRCAVSHLEHCRGRRLSGKPESRPEVGLAGLHGWTQKLCGVLLGIRFAGDVTRETHDARDFVNFRVGGQNTLFTGGVLTHNCGIGSALAGRGAHMLLIDDAHSEQDVLNGNFEVFKKAYEWFTYGARTRLMPGGRVAIIGTRWHMDDLIGRVTSDMVKNVDSDQYEVFEFPAILEVNDPETGAAVQKALWPEFFDLPALLRTKASMPAFQWNAQYQQRPTAEEAALIKRDWWRIWEKDQPPACEYIIMSLDAAAETHNRADYTSLTTWGVFNNEEEGSHNIILLHAIKGRYEFPELKKMALEAYRDWEPDAFIVEKKSAGAALYQEMRRMGLPVSEYTPHRGTGDKLARLNSVADIVSSGMCWVPERRWAEDLVEEIAAFPFGSNDDQVDSTVMALMRFRQGGFITLPTDDWEDSDPEPLRKVGYY